MEYKYDFDSEKEAQQILDEARTISLGFCPEIKEMCRNDCVCYQKGTISHYTKTLKKHWRVCQPYCSNVNILGIITAYPE